MSEPFYITPEVPLTGNRRGGDYARTEMEYEGYND